MKTTGQRLGEAYCRPMNEADLNHFGCDDGVHIVWKGSMHKGHNGLSYHYERVFGLESLNRALRGKTEIPAQHFIDLIEDKIVAWRLVEDCFKESIRQETSILTLVLDGETEVLINKDGLYQIWQIQTIDQISERNHVDFENIKTYTDLITLINLLK